MPASTRSCSGATWAGFDDQTTSAATGGSRSGSVSASPSCDMLIRRTSAARSSAPSIAALGTALQVAVGI